MGTEISLQDLVNKIDYEGGVGEALFYFGREVHSEDMIVNEAWKTAYDAVDRLVRLLPDVDHSNEKGFCYE